MDLDNSEGAGCESGVQARLREQKEKFGTTVIV